MKKFLLYSFSLILLSACGKSIEQSANKYIGAPYVLDPLGEGVDGKFDTDPIRRTDVFDCLTFVETVLADTGRVNLQCIRYKDCDIDWFSRNHWMETEWIPNTIELGLITPITSTNTSTHATVNLPQWYYEKTGAENNARPFEMSIAYIPRDNITPEFLQALPYNTLIAFIRCDIKNNIVTGDMITHVGFLFGGKTLIHAGQKSGVESVPFLEYMGTARFCGAAFYEIN
jgi:hypothetical protein